MEAENSDTAKRLNTKKQSATLLQSVNNITSFCDEHEFCSDCELYFDTGICPFDTFKEVLDKGFMHRLEELAERNAERLDGRNEE